MTRRPLNVTDLTKDFWCFLALGVGTGLSPKAPGTVGTLAALPIIWFLPQQGWIYPLVVLAMVIYGILICHKASVTLAIGDHSGIVWDEIAGMAITMLFVAITPLNLFIGFVLFRFFDIIKPWPINWLDRQVKGGLGIMLDDVIAGLFAGLALYLLVIFVI